MNYKAKKAIKQAFHEVFINIPLFILWVFTLIFIPVDIYATWNELVEPTFTKGWDTVLELLLLVLCIYLAYGFFDRYNEYRKLWD